MEPEAAPTVALPAAAPRVTGVDSAAAREHRRLVAAFGGEARAPALQALLDEQAGRLAAAADPPAPRPRVTLLDSPAVNAFALPSGGVYVTRGLMALVNDTAESAAVLAHEMAHLALHHADARAEVEGRGQLAARVASEVLRDEAEGRRERDRSRLTLAGFSRAQESEADAAGVRAAARAGYDPYGAARVLASLDRSTRRVEAGGTDAPRATPDVGATHPGAGERARDALFTARAIGAPGGGEADGPRLLGALEGLSYGDDPSDGVVRGRRFLHPRLGFAFEAPEGFGLDDSGSAVVGVGAGGAEALRLEAIRLAEGRGPADHLREGLFDGARAVGIEALDLDGLPAATASARTAEWAYRLLAVRLGARAYLVVYAARALDAGTEARFSASMRSFRRLPPAEARGVRAARIAAAAGASQEEVAGRMALPDRSGPDRRLETFRLLNALEPGAPLEAGRRYKLVVE